MQRRAPKLLGKLTSWALTVQMRDYALWCPEICQLYKQIIDRFFDVSTYACPEAGQQISKTRCPAVQNSEIYKIYIMPGTKKKAFCVPAAGQ